MKKVLFLGLFLGMMVGCVSYKTKQEGKVSCLTANKTYQSPDDIGFNCKDKLTETQRDFRVDK